MIVTAGSSFEEFSRMKVRALSDAVYDEEAVSSAVFVYAKSKLIYA